MAAVPLVHPVSLPGPVAAALYPQRRVLAARPNIGPPTPEASRPAVALVHGFALSPGMWSPLLRAAHLTNVWRVRLPGHGPGRLTPPMPARFQALVDHTAVALAGLGPLHLVGHSMGARLALALALRHPLQIASLTLIGGSAGLSQPRDRLARRQREAGWQAALGRHGVARFMAQWERLPLFAGEASMPDKMRRQLSRWRRSHSIAGLVACLGSLGLAQMPSLWGELARLDMPVLCLAGAQDAAYLAAAKRMAAAIGAQAHAAAVVGAGHNPALEAPERTAALVLAHMRVAKRR